MIQISLYYIHYDSKMVLIFTFTYKYLSFVIYLTHFLSILFMLVIVLFETSPFICWHPISEFLDIIYIYTHKIFDLYVISLDSYYGAGSQFSFILISIGYCTWNIDVIFLIEIFLIISRLMSWWFSYNVGVCINGNSHMLTCSNYLVLRIFIISLLSKKYILMIFPFHYLKRLAG